jgi:uncharacterized protein YdcH (DUF465 family)
VSGDDVRNAEVDHALDLVLELKLAALQSRQLKLVAGRLGGESKDPLIEVAVLGFERLKSWPRLVVIHAEAFTHVSWRRNRSIARPSARYGGQAEQMAETRPRFRDLLSGGDTSFLKGAPMEKASVEELQSKHAAVHALIDQEENRQHPDEDLLHRLKKEKLRLKDELNGHLTHH